MARLIALEGEATAARADRAELANRLAMSMQSHQALHMEMDELRRIAQGAGGHTGGNGRRPIIEPKLLMPDKFGKRLNAGGVSWRDWSFTALTFLSFVQDDLGQILRTIEGRATEVTLADLPGLGVRGDTDVQLRHILVNRTEGDALECVRAARDKTGIEQWRQLSNLYDPNTASNSLQDCRVLMNPPRVSDLSKLPHAIQMWENLERRYRDRGRGSMEPEMRLSCLMQMCPAEVERSVQDQQHMFRTYEALRTHLMTLVSLRTKGPAPMLYNLDAETEIQEDTEYSYHFDEEGELFALSLKTKVMSKKGSGKGSGKSGGRPGVYQKGGGKGADRECFQCGRKGHIRADCVAKAHVNGGPLKPMPKSKAANSLEEDSSELESPLSSIDLGSIEAEQITEGVEMNSFDLLSDHGDSEYGRDDTESDNPADLPKETPLAGLDSEDDCARYGKAKRGRAQCVDSAATNADPWAQEDPWRKSIRTAAPPESMPLHSPTTPAMSFGPTAPVPASGASSSSAPAVVAPPSPPSVPAGTWPPAPACTELPAGLQAFGCSVCWQKGVYGNRASPVPAAGIPPWLTPPAGGAPAPAMHVAASAQAFEIGTTPGGSPSKKSSLELECLNVDDDAAEFMSAMGDDEAIAGQFEQCADFEEDEIDLNVVDVSLNQVVPEGGFCEITVDSGAGESVINPDDVPGAILRPSEGSRRGQRYVGAGGERLGNLGELVLSVKTESEGGANPLSRITFQGAKVRKPLLAVSGIVNKGNMVVFDESGSYILTGRAKSRDDIQKAIARAPGKIPLHQKNGVFVMKSWRAEKLEETPVFSRQGAR